MLYRSYTEVPLGNQTLKQLGIHHNVVLKLRDEDVIDILLERFEHEPKKLTVNRRIEFLEFQRKLQVVTRIPVHLQLVCHNQTNLFSFKEKTLREHRIPQNAKFFIYDKTAVIEISTLTSKQGTKSLILHPTTDIPIPELQEILERQTKIPGWSQILIQNKMNLSLCKLTLGQLGISGGAQFELYDERVPAKISVITPEHGDIQLAVLERVEIVELQTTLQKLTKIPFREQMIFHNKIDLSLSRQTLLQLGMRPQAEFILFDKCTIFTINLRIIYNDEDRKFKLVPQQTIKLLIQVVQLTWPAKHLRDKSAITFVCRPNPD